MEKIYLVFNVYTHGNRHFVAAFKSEMNAIDSLPQGFDSSDFDRATNTGIFTLDGFKGDEYYEIVCTEIK